MAGRACFSFFLFFCSDFVLHDLILGLQRVQDKCPPLYTISLVPPWAIKMSFIYREDNSNRFFVGGLEFVSATTWSPEHPEYHRVGLNPTSHHENSLPIKSHCSISLLVNRIDMVLGSFGSHQTTNCTTRLPFSWLTLLFLSDLKIQDLSFALL